MKIRVSKGMTRNINSCEIYGIMRSINAYLTSHVVSIDADQLRIIDVIDHRCIRIAIIKHNAPHIDVIPN